MAEQHYKTIEERMLEWEAERAARPLLIKILDGTVSFLRYRLPEKIKFILAPKYPITKEHRQIGLTYWDRPRKVTDYFNADYSLAWNTYPILLRFSRAEKWGIPMDFVYEGEDGMEQWNDTINKMVYAFEAILSCADGEYYGSVEQQKAINAKIEEGLALYAKYFRALWD